jgi:hypothetical protein
MTRSFYFSQMLQIMIKIGGHFVHHLSKYWFVKFQSVLTLLKQLFNGDLKPTHTLVDRIQLIFITAMSLDAQVKANVALYSIQNSSLLSLRLISDYYKTFMCLPKQIG